MRLLIFQIFKYALKKFFLYLHFINLLKNFKNWHLSEIFTLIHYSIELIYIFFSSSEKDLNGDTLWTWTYPSVTDEQKTIITRKYNLQSEYCNTQSFVFSRYNNEWFYINSSEVFDTDKLPRVSTFLFFIISFFKKLNYSLINCLCQALSHLTCAINKNWSLLNFPTFWKLNLKCFISSKFICLFLTSLSWQDSVF